MNTCPSESLGFLIHDAARLLRRRFEVRATELGLSSAQWRLLVHLNREGAATQARLAELLEVEPISVSRLVDRMQEAGWVTREADPRDRRAKLVLPTAAARETYSDARRLAEGIYAEALQGVDAQARESLVQALRAMIFNLSETKTGADVAPEGTRDVR
ncbi:MarR family winged helix-turn-helix transcriptional regulator [Albidovulum sp.]|uniref:MarR family winged helix-turn-helix transcriptional regulator n=1 Tax=Albidovulum sp. TaxID=1872424 RepID=UPI001DD89C04|nr:MarR family transcriptional regulator [Paracoccaceae bacterium]HPE24084.1 MarR family transcriptional regulator [Albidovulum sp.]MCB2123094.1 MarR family transcriptional regulator [Paracoccaceae bacterium]MCB2131998.1 MarR family transcriptional regulator [Paracoccaceae bacterium]MCB2138788.1 MarR family transcriptional regulator [Paracoccaceae bacterium]